MKKAAQEETVEIQPIQIRNIEITIVGDSPLICHKWSDKAKKMMLDKQMKKAANSRNAKDPEQDFLESLYEHPDGGYGFPAVAFKAAAVRAAKGTNMTMTDARVAFHVLGDLVKIEGTPTPREDMVRIGGGKSPTADIRYRGEFKTWSATLNIRFNNGMISAEQIVNLLNTAGFGVGIGEWRPEKSETGSYGLFHVETEKERSA